tara:strand:- start:1645 stop:2811 length:1167 start_codon:yes stop_codon:yes gene_type:complete
MGVTIPILLIIVSCLIIWRACDGFDLASRYIGRNLSDGVRGATINAISSSIPELFTTAFFLLFLNDTNGFSGGIGTTAGSAVFNAVVIPALVILVVAFFLKKDNIYVSKKVILRDGISLIIAEIILIILITGDTLFWWHGIILMITYFLYIFFMLSMMNKKENNQEISDFETSSNNSNKIQSFFKLDLESLIIGKSNVNQKNAWQLLIVSTFIIGTSCLLLVAACEMISLEYYTLPFFGELKGLNIPILFVAVILASAATSVPDTIISIRDAKNGDYNDALSNALGSNIFDICFALGFPLFLYCIFYGPIQMDVDTVKFSSELRILLLVITIFSFLIFYFGKYMTKTKGLLLFSIYILFIIYIISLSLEIKWALMISDQISKIYLFLI